MKFKRNPPLGNVRQVVSTGQNIRGIFTNKAGRLVQFESWAERALLLRLDRDRDIHDYGSQPERFQFTAPNGKQHSYTPDFIVWRSNGQVEIHEVTMTSRQTRPNIVQREAAANEICRVRGWQYIVHTEKSVPQGSELANLLVLFRYRPSVYADLAVSRMAGEELAAKSPVALQTLVTRIEQKLGIPRPTIVATLCHMLWAGQMETDLSQLIFGAGNVGFSPAAWVQMRIEPVTVAEYSQGERP
jgi:hypothetical protein